MSTFDPLPRVLFSDDFDRGMNGWTLMTGNYAKSLESVLPEQRDFRPPMLSNLTMWDTGTAGSLTGTYALKLATRPQRGSQSVALKRLTYAEPSPILVEAWFTSKPEASRMDLAELDVRSFGIFLDIQDETHRVMPHVRYVNAEEGQAVHRWRYKKDPPPPRQLSNTTRTHFHLGPDGWLDVPGGEQDLCYNELPTKQNWQYLRLGFDLRTMAFTTLGCNGRSFDAVPLEPIRMPAWPNLWRMLNVGFWVDTDVDNRAFLYLDSVQLSIGGEAA